MALCRTLTHLFFMMPLAPLEKVRVIREGSRAHVLGLMTKAMARETEAAGLMFLSPSSPKSAVRTQRNPIPQT